jgi:hypothetical protein
VARIAYDFGRFDEVVDIGGGHGAFITAMLRRWPGLAGILFDQPHVVAGAPDLLAEAGVEDRCRIVGGSFFETVPSGADAYVFKNVVHDWPDGAATEILRTCRKNVGESATVLLAERIIAGPNEGLDAAFSDLNMLVAPGGVERTEAEYAMLLATAGFRLTAVAPTASDISLVEARPA